MLKLLSSGGSVPSLAILLLFGIYYALSTLFVVCTLMFTASIRLRNSFSASVFANLFSLVASLIILNLSASSLTLHNTLVFSISNLVFQSIMFTEGFDMSIQSFLLPLIVGNSLTYWLIFPNVIRLMQL